MKHKTCLQDNSLVVATDADASFISKMDFHVSDRDSEMER